MPIQLNTEPETGRIVLHFVLPAAEHADSVSVVGNFNDWTPGNHLLTDHGDGTIGVNVPVEAGSIVHFRYLGSNGRWFDDPDAADLTADGCLFHVPEQASVEADPVDADRPAASAGTSDVSVAPSLSPAPTAASEAAGTATGKARQR